MVAVRRPRGKEGIPIPRHRPGYKIVCWLPFWWLVNEVHSPLSVSFPSMVSLDPSFNTGSRHSYSHLHFGLVVRPGPGKDPESVSTICKGGGGRTSSPLPPYGGSVVGRSPGF
ncbi:hypothetical protein SUGI_1223430 [Cryptomeria japonica]|uniref:Uncharacterized protein n=1 Tax=Cryptomeria japonica TaxID=3369 RepID=A0AAD3NMT4_CRYJA|nr:hypothetical protein SUGI_1223430 [Cryptomeria japonica]